MTTILYKKELKMNLSEALDKFYRFQAKLSAYNHATEALYYDGVTVAPKGTAENRAHALGILGEESYLISTDPENVELMEYLDLHKDRLDTRQKRAVYLGLKNAREMKKIPIEEYVAYKELLVKAEDVWHCAKENNDFAAFCPYLEEIFETNKRFASYISPDKKPYDHWLNSYEKGLDMEKCDEFFSALKARIVPLIKRISEKPQLSDSCINGTFPKADQEKLSYKLMALIGLDLDRCGLGASEHPFTIMLGSHRDVRITTRYDESNFSSSMFSVIHEGGHALYDGNSDDDLAYTFLDGGVSMGVHESQSRFYENILGRSRTFIEALFPALLSIFPEAMKDKSPEDIYRAVNKVSPSLIRVEADEVTYCLHVMVRYELEKRVMAGELEVKDLPKEWNRLYKEYLGVDVPTDSEGVLQDSHWAGGCIGYFPSYALGSAYGAQLLAKMKETVDVDGCLKSGDFAPINAWNRDRIWRHGCTYGSGDLFRMAAEGEFDPSYYTDYLERKYGELYGI